MTTRFEKLKELLKNRNDERGASPLEEWVLKFFPPCKIFNYQTEFQVDYYFIDIAFPQLKYGVELDGKEYHTDKIKDEKRDQYLASQGWEIKRIPSEDCWPRKVFGLQNLARHLLEIYNRVNGNRPIPWGLAELLQTEEWLAPRAPTDEEMWNKLIYCRVCGISHFSPEHTEEYAKKFIKK